MIENKALLVLVNKPKGISSFSVVNIVKKVTGATKAGHLGTLDVAGEGLLPVALNKATTLFDYYLNKDKVYKTVFQFGITTDTLDLEGEITATDNKIITRNDIQTVIQILEGTYPQMPPMYSAKKINGQKAYDIARAGGQVELKPKTITVYSIKLLKEIKQNVFEFEIHCSSGTYIRSIARDMAQKLSTYGVMQSILRTRCGDFLLANAFTLEEIKNNKFEVIPIENIFNFPKINFDETQTSKLLNGVWIEIDINDGDYKAYNKDTFLGIINIQNKSAKFKFRFV